MARIPTPAVAAAAIPALAAAAAPSTPIVSVAEAPETDETTSGDLVPARVLVAYDDHEPNDVVRVTEAELAVLERDSKVDPHPDAVAYALSLQA